MTSRLSLLLVVASLALVACGDDEEKEVLACPGTPCGGEPAGTWTLKKACLDDEEATGTQRLDGCPEGRITSRVDYEGTLTFEGGQVVSALTARLRSEIRLPSSCLTAHGDPGLLCDRLEAQFRETSFDPEEIALPEVRCAMAGGNCDCDLEVPLPLDFWDAAYEVDGETLRMLGQASPFCVDGDTLWINDPDGAQGMVFGR